MRKYFIVWPLLALILSIAGVSHGQTAATPGAGPSASQTRVVGEVTGVDSTARRVMVKTDDGKTVAVATDEKSATLRLPPGETSAEKAVRITLAEVAVGDRLFARGIASTDGQTVTARQLVVTAQAAGVAQQQRTREDWRQRGLTGRITGIDAAKREVMVFARSREGAGPITLVASGNTRFLRYAPDSANLKDAVPASFAELKVGDQIRARGDKSPDGARFTAEEIISGSFQRTGGTITAVNPTAGEITVKSEQSGNTLTVAIGKRTTLRRVTPEAAAEFEQRNEQRRQQRRDAGERSETEGQQGAQGAERRAENRAERRARGDGPRAGGRNFPEAFQNLLAITINELKKGDPVFIVGSAGADASHLTAVTLLTGDADFLNRLQRFQGRPNRDGSNMSPGLPGDVMGGGTGNRDQP